MTTITLVWGLAIFSLIWHTIGIFLAVSKNESQPHLWKINRSLGIQITGLFLMQLAQIMLLLHIAERVK